MGIDKSNPKYKQLITVSNPSTVIKNADEYLGKENYEIFISNSSTHKYTIINKQNGKKVNFGNISYEDFTYHRDKIRRDNYLKRSAGIRGDWRDNKYSANSLSRALLWTANG